MTSIYLGNQAVYDPLVLPNNSRINGVEHFYQTTKPTTRGDGSALGVGDRWWKTDEGTEWFWNGTYWLSAWRNSTTGKRASGIGVPNYTDATEWSYIMGRRIFVHSASASLTLASAGDASNYVYFSLKAVRKNNGVLTIYESPTKLYVNGENLITSEPVNTVVPAVDVGLPFIGINTSFAAVGSPPTFTNIAGSITWSLVYD